MLFRLALIFAVAGLGACSQNNSPVDQTTTRYLDNVSAAVADAAARADLLVFLRTLSDNPVPLPAP